MLTGVTALPGCMMVLLCRILWGEGMLGPMGVDCRSRRRSSSNLPASCIVLYCTCIGLYGSNLALNEPIRPGEVGERGDMVYVVALQELGKLIGHKGGTIIDVDKAGQFIHSTLPIMK